MNAPNFNFDLFIKNSNFSDYTSFNIIKDALKTPDEVGSTLRMHLFFERILESWIYANCNREDFFENTQVGFWTKLQIASNLGLPQEVFDIAKKLNRIRNKIAHHLINESSNGIDNSLLDSLKDIFKNKIIKNHPQWQGNDIGMFFYDDDGNPEISVNINDKNLKQHVLLTVICTLTLTYLVIKSKEN
ncbi:hypothetical protein [Neisseria zalophi]|uniref:hypothetical protein n=1 Tax=Neisseria zalophi TaxID=640030 RepID=UPI00178096A3|nr:hypothetical protein [Neisseria zalophi]